MRRPPTRHLLLGALAPAALLLLAACADGSAGTSPTPSVVAPVASPTAGRPLGPAPSVSRSAVPAAAGLTVEVDATGEGATETWTLTCDPTGGTHPDPQAACLVLGTAEGRAALEPVPMDTACTQLWGGPQTAHVTGTLDGQAVDATFSRSDGCQIARWDALEPLLGTGGA